MIYFPLKYAYGLTKLLPCYCVKSFYSRYYNNSFIYLFWNYFSSTQNRKSINKEFPNICCKCEDDSKNC